MAIGQAASASWGGGWLGRSGIALREPGPILEGAQHASATGTGGRVGAVVRPVIDLVVDGIARRKRTVVTPRAGWLLVWTNRFFPRFVESRMERI